MARENLHADNRAFFAVRHPQRSVARFLGFLAENRDDQTLFRRQFALRFGRDFADQNVLREHFGADANDAVLVQVLQLIFADVGNIARDFFRAQFGVARFDFVFLDVNRSQQIFAAKRARERIMASS